MMCTVYSHTTLNAIQYYINPWVDMRHTMVVYLDEAIWGKLITSSETWHLGTSILDRWRSINLNYFYCMLDSFSDNQPYSSYDLVVKCKLSKAEVLGLIPGWDNFSQLSPVVFTMAYPAKIFDEMITFILVMYVIVSVSYICVAVFAYSAAVHNQRSQFSGFSLNSGFLICYFMYKSMGKCYFAGSC